MSKITITFNDTNYQVDESALSPAINSIKGHLSTVMNGNGETISFGGTSYSIDSTKLQHATDTFISHLNDVAGDGLKTFIDGIEYPIDSTKMSGAMNDLCTIFNGFLPKIAAGLYETGSNYTVMIQSWDELLSNGIFVVENGAVVRKTGYRTLSGDLMLPTDGSITSIGDNGFAQCTKLTNIAMNNNITIIGNSAFSSCGNLTNIDIPDSVVEIGTHVFNRCSGLVNVKLPNDITRIPDYTFQKCSGLVNIKIPNSVKNIGEDAFNGCTNLVSIEIPESVMFIDYNAFVGCTNLTNIIFKGERHQWGDIAISSSWIDSTVDYTINCTDGFILKENTLSELTISIDGNLLTITPIENATSYGIYVRNDDMYTLLMITEDTTVDLSTLCLESGSYAIHVSARAEGYMYSGINMSGKWYTVA